MTLKVWDLKTGKEVRTLKGHSNSVYVVSISPDGNYAVSASFDNTLKVWDLLTGKEIAAFNGESPFYCAVFSRDGTIIVAGEESGTMHFLLFEREVSTRNKALILGSQ
jgi:WD40 repeat protein